MDAHWRSSNSFATGYFPNVAAPWLRLKTQSADLILGDKPSDWVEAAIQTIVIRIIKGWVCFLSSLVSYFFPSPHLLLKLTFSHIAALSKCADNVNRASLHVFKKSATASKDWTAVIYFIPLPFLFLLIVLYPEAEWYSIIFEVYDTMIHPAYEGPLNLNAGWFCRFFDTVLNYFCVYLVALHNIRPCICIKDRSDTWPFLTVIRTKTRKNSPLISFHITW